MSPAFRETVRDAALDVVSRWSAGRMSRGRWLWLGPLTLGLAAAAAEDAGEAEGPVDAFGRAITAAVMAALFLNVAVKRVRDLDLGDWPGALVLHAALAVSALAPPLFAVLLIAYALVMFLAPGRR